MVGEKGAVRFHSLLSGLEHEVFGPVAGGLVKEAFASNLSEGVGKADRPDFDGLIGSGIIEGKPRQLIKGFVNAVLAWAGVVKTRLGVGFKE